MKQRLLYIDFLRGLCIFVVLYSHILLFSIGGSSSSALTNFLRSFFLPMFFYISGFVSYKETGKWNLLDTIHYVWKKTRTLLIPTIVSCGVFIVFIHGNVIGFVTSGAKGGYWFTYVLFLMTIIYGITMLILNRINNSRIYSVMIFGIAFTSYLLKKTPISEGYWADVFSLGSLFYYLPFFLTGILCKKHIEIFHAMIEKDWVKFTLFIVVLAGFWTSYVPFIVHNVAIVFFVYYLAKYFVENLLLTDTFKWYKQFFNIFLLLGKYSIEIYFIHYFLLFRFPKPLSDYLLGLYSDNCYAGSSSAGFVEFIIVGTISILIALVCIFIKHILDYIPYVSTLMFGAQNKKTK